MPPSRPALLFPGQGAQFVGMGRDFEESSPAARRVLDEAHRASGFDLRGLCFDGPEDRNGARNADELRAELAEQVERSVAAGAKLLLGGRVPDGPGNFYPPTVLAEPVPGSPAWDDELFGPVATLFKVADLDAAIALANHKVFGLGASAWTSDPAEQTRLAVEIEAGSVFLNGMVKSDPRLPFGGIKRSGFGRELSLAGIREFVNVKTVWIA